jgi:hypothetical protein
MLLQLQVILLDEPENLPDLVRFRLPANLLDVHDLSDFRMNKDVMPDYTAVTAGKRPVGLEEDEISSMGD